MSLRSLRLALVFTLLVSALLLSISADASAAYDSKLKRYPYLTDVVNSGATGYATANWATDRSHSSGRVKYGQVAADGSCVPATTVTATKMSITVNSVSEYQWKAQLTLAPDTEYCYRPYFGSGNIDLLGSDPTPRFRTQLPAGSTPFSFAVLGDSGELDSTGNNPHQANVMAQIASSGARFGLGTGDLVHAGSATQTAYGDLVQTGPGISAFFRPNFWKAPGASIPFFPALGNHGLNSTFLQNWPQDRAASSSGGRSATDTYCCLNGTTSKSYPSVWYAFDAGNARFYVLKTAWSDSNGGRDAIYKNDYDYHWTPTSAEYRWLENDLATHPSQVKFAFFHFPLYSDNATETSDTFLQGQSSLEGLLSRYGVDVAFNGHAHIYQRNRKPDGGVVSYITGGGGAKPAPITKCSAIDAYGIGWSNSTSTGSACGGASRPTAIEQVYHFLLVRVDGANVTVTPIDELGRRFDEQTYDFSTGSEPPPPPPPPPPSGQTLKFSPDADARVEEANPGTNYGASSNLYVDKTPDKNTYLRFTVSGVTAPIQSAKLRLYAFNGSVDGPGVRGTSSDWTESGITWTNRPAATTGLFDDKGAVGVNTWVEFDVKPIVTGDGTYSFLVDPTSTDGVDFYSKEATSANRPELILTTG